MRETILAAAPGVVPAGAPPARLHARLSPVSARPPAPLASPLEELEEAAAA